MPGGALMASEPAKIALLTREQLPEGKPPGPDLSLPWR